MSDLLRVLDLSITDKRNQKTLVSHLSFELKEAQTLGIIGESGSGKSLSCKAIMGLNAPWLDVRGSILFEGQELIGSSQEMLRHLRGKKIAMVLQDAINAFDPLSTIGAHMLESLIEFKSFHEANELSLYWLHKMGLKASNELMQAYPHELSGGMLQRVMIALALAQETRLIIADEPTSALDVIHQRHIIELLKTIQEEEKKTLLFVSHDLGVISFLSENVLVMKEGRCVEYQKAEQLFRAPSHEYTRYLIQTRHILSKRFQQCFA
ncbi:ABC transporter ATP-binding protein [Sulfurospirillum sp.]|uniref:ABC transporter ATP-binding protein n=1 Tax=Sulfurospirillum sp. TaxID=2053622 RepID=UPI002FDEC95B